MKKKKIIRQNKAQKQKIKEQEQKIKEQEQKIKEQEQKIKEQEAIKQFTSKMQTQSATKGHLNKTNVLNKLSNETFDEIDGFIADHYEDISEKMSFVKNKFIEFALLDLDPDGNYDAMHVINVDFAFSLLNNFIIKLEGIKVRRERLLKL